MFLFKLECCVDRPRSLSKMNNFEHWRHIHEEIIDSHVLTLLVGWVGRSRGDAPDKALSPGVVFGLGAASGAVSAVSATPACGLDPALACPMVCGVHRSLRMSC